MDASEDAIGDMSDLAMMEMGGSDLGKQESPEREEVPAQSPGDIPHRPEQSGGALDMAHQPENPEVVKKVGQIPEDPAMCKLCQSNLKSGKT